MSATAILRTRIDLRRKARVEKILDQLGMTSTQAVNMFFAEIERRKAIPFPVAIEDNSDIAPPIEHVAKVWGDLDEKPVSLADAMGDLLGSVQTGQRKKSLSGYGRD
jgi:DNA-damage-inducible protein J